MAKKRKQVVVRSRRLIVDSRRLTSVRGSRAFICIRALSEALDLEATRTDFWGYTEPWIPVANFYQIEASTTQWTNGSGTAVRAEVQRDLRLRGKVCAFVNDQPIYLRDAASKLRKLGVGATPKKIYARLLYEE